MLCSFRLFAFDLAFDGYRIGVLTGALELSGSLHNLLCKLRRHCHWDPLRPLLSAQHMGSARPARHPPVRDLVPMMTWRRSAPRLLGGTDPPGSPVAETARLA